ncbi:hypothetical protein ACFQWB_06575 [Paenibacillus thermoaerophilus]|uniref:Uncharacterized protein n=1 Tax=Paenibacillus thermoaerophilus TaxID=1215385 RepID=A0ABW2V3J2_9BACL|nr:hypothetical protein [Paenibacillus thermoaerophilus]
MDKLLQEELAAKRERFIRMKTRMAHLPFHKTWTNSISDSSRPSMNAAFGSGHPAVYRASGEFDLSGTAWSRENPSGRCLGAGGD